MSIREVRDIYGNVEYERGSRNTDHVWDDQTQECSCGQRPCPHHEPYATSKRSPYTITVDDEMVTYESEAEGDPSVLATLGKRHRHRECPARAGSCSWARSIQEKVRGRSRR